MTTSYTVGGLTDGRTYYFVVTAYNTLRNESGYSNEVSKAIPDITAPVFSTIAAGTVSSSGATISWLTDEPATSQVEYGLTTAYGALTPLDSTRLTTHRVTLTSLTPSTLYHYRVHSRDAAGNTAVSADRTFTTAIPDTTPPIIAAVGTSRVTATAATINWTTNEPSDSRVEYGPTTAYQSSTPLNVTPVTNHSMTLSGLMTSTTYHFRVTSRDAAGNVAVSGDSLFTTAASSTLSRLRNFSARGLVQTGEQVLTGGLIIGGTTPKTVLIRGRGPTLTDFGVAGALADPLLQLYFGRTVIAQNNDWQVADPLCATRGYVCGTAAQITATGLDPCVGNRTDCARESVLLITLPPGAYSAIVSGVGGSSGVGLVEVFEADGGVSSKLINISSRARVETGDNVLIGGFIIDGTAPKRVVLRARGPSMSGAPFFIPGALADPVIELYSGASVIARNDDWQTPECPLGTVCLQGGVAIDAIPPGFEPCQPNPGQTVEPPNCAQEAALLVTLPPGPYTAIVRGVGGGRGVGLVEVFEVP